MSKLATLVAALRARGMRGSDATFGRFIARDVLGGRGMHNTLTSASFKVEKTDYEQVPERSGGYVTYAKAIWVDVPINPYESAAAAALITDAQTEARVKYSS